MQNDQPGGMPPDDGGLGEVREQGRVLARQYKVSRRKGRNTPLLNRLARDEELLRAGHQRFRQASTMPVERSYAAEWLLDNYYVAQQAIHQIREDLPRGYYRELPMLAEPPFAGLPRAYGLAREVTHLAEGPLDLERISALLEAFQSAVPLTMGELWAFPTMLRMVTVGELAEAVGLLAGLDAGQHGAVDTASEEATVAHAMLSLRAIAVYDWKEFFERVSIVEGVLRTDPAGLYASADFYTRDHYRKVVEQLALAAGRSEVDVARAAVGHAAAEAERQGVVLPQAEPWAGLHLPAAVHVGYSLVGAGRPDLEAALAIRRPWPARAGRWLLDHAVVVYLGSILFLTVSVVVLLALYAAAAGAGPWGILAAALLSLLPASQLGIDLVNWGVTRLVKPRVLPKLDFKDGLPAACETMVVIPALLAGEADVDSLLQALELHYLSNSDPRLSFALLTDFADAPEKEMPEDAALLERARTSIHTLNDRYAASGRRPFYFFHRERRWNAAEGCWMAWERKRGKLEEFNRLLTGTTPTSFIVLVGDLDVLPRVRYVITLDADTALPRESGPRLVGALAHPLNRAEFDANGRVVAGYSLLQPRVEIRPSSANRSLFTRIFSGDTGLDLYTHAVSDVYQDLFGEGIYVGKGIYDVRAFQRSLAGRVPENALLSHDLFEGIHSRCALVTDITLYEDFPPHYLAHARRMERWIRGDWQLLPWLLPRVPVAGSGARPNSLPAIGLWKLFDNLRRSLLAPALLVLLVAGWAALPGSPWVWTLAAVLAPAVAVLAAAAGGLVTGARKLTLAGLGGPVISAAERWLLALVFLPFEALLALQAAVLTLARLLVTHRHLLQWTSAASTARLFGDEGRPALTWRQMGSALILSLAFASLVAVARPAALSAAAPLLSLWLLSPAVANWISRPAVHEEPPLSAQQQNELRALARRTWLFFERMVGPDDHWLPPDHFQEEPRGTVAHRTSPTNIGLLLLATLGAFDLGYLGLLGLALRLRDTFATLSGLERHRGHFLNWYDTASLDPLAPRYVSTVDSGNLAACLIALRQGCLELPGRPVLRWERWQGLLDTLAFLGEGLASSTDPAARAFIQHLESVRQQVIAGRDDPAGWPALLAAVSGEGRQKLDELLAALIEAGPQGLDVDALRGLRLWHERVQHHLVSMQREVDLLVPWLTLLRQAPSWPDDPGVEAEWQGLQESLPAAVALGEIAPAARAADLRLVALEAHLDRLEAASVGVDAARDWCRRLRQALEAGRMGAGSLLAAYHDIAMQSDEYVQATDFSFLFDPQRQVFHIGYNVTAGQLDQNYYDLLASEARIASLLAVAKGDVPTSHWLHLARPVTKVQGDRVLLSWSGTLFEYLMPRLMVRDYPGTFLAESARGAVQAQIAYAQQKAVPWGISESGYYYFDANLNYQYRAFGLPALGFKRGLADDLVITPYASLLALSLAPHAVLDNLHRLAAIGMLGRLGCYEAVDFTRSRLALGQKHARVQSYMAHHQGMILVSLVNYLAGAVMVDRFHHDRRIQSADLLLQERVPGPGQAPIEYPKLDEISAVAPMRPAPPLEPWRVSADTSVPEVHYLSNGRYGVLLTNSGGGMSRWNEVDLTRWRADTTLDDWGQWIYLQDLDSGATWSAGVQPVRAEAANHEVLFFPHKAEFRSQLDSKGLTLVMEVTVPPDDDLEVRRITLTNHGDRPRRLRLTSYGELVLASQAADRRHPAFNKLFIESEFVHDLNALLFRRRPRAAGEEPVFLAHWLAVDRDRPLTRAREADRARFLGRLRDVHNPAALQDLTGRYLSGTTGATLDPILSIGQEVELEPYGTAQVAYFTAAAASRQELLDLAGRYQNLAPLDRAVGQARTESERSLRPLGIDTPALERIEQLYSVLLYPCACLRADRQVLATNTKGQSGLWPYAISGDYPILLVQVKSEDHVPLVRELLQAHAYWRQRRIHVDLVILNRRESGYAQELQGHLNRAIADNDGQAWLNCRGGIFMLSAEGMPEADQVLLSTAARAVLDGDRGSLAEQLRPLRDRQPRLPLLVPTLGRAEDVEPTLPVARPGGLQFDNGLGGFGSDGREYVIFVEPDHPTPAPWINVAANPRLGFIASEAGAGWSWAENSGENRLTPWANDPVGDRPGEALYLRDEETGIVWTPTPLPAGPPAPTIVRHGAGYSRFEHHSHGLRQRLTLFVAPDDPVKVVQLCLENTWQRIRRVTVTYYAEWVLGTTHDETQAYILPEYVPAGNAILARNPYSAEFGGRIAFAAASRPLHGLTADRAEFVGRLGSLARPAAMRRIGLAGVVEPALDPCAALQVHVNLQPGESVTVHFLLGQGQDREEALRLIDHYRAPEAVQAAWDAAAARWDDVLGAVTVQTPDPAIDLLLNRWLLYQTLSCRVWGRSALYQSSGAYGFRDQLQDVMALLAAAPDLAREHILRAARHQFEAGDVLHWWHPPSGRGIRSRCSDDMLWLPFVAGQYVAATGDRSILSEQVPFLKGPLLEPGQDERYGQYESTAETYTLLEHCWRALRRGSTAGSHGIPLIGSGDWNDGLNRVGAEGKGESVWMGWFLYAILEAFAALSAELGDERQAQAYREQAGTLQSALETNTWDGAWYLRAFYDDGTPLGSVRSRECQIDSIAQSWAVLSGAGDPEHAARAMAAFEDRLVRDDEHLILLFTPPFDRTLRDPGYIRGYLPGIRENGGQYTHAALWGVWALTELGHGDRAAELFRLLSPISHAGDAAGVERYRVEPYVVAADVYSVPPHTGRGGWTWYTGSAAWMYRLGVEAILGVQLRGGSLSIAPCIPSDWPGYELTVRHAGSRYHIVVENPDRVQNGVREITLDGAPVPGHEIPLSVDGRTHEVRVRLGSGAEPGTGGPGLNGRRFLPHPSGIASEKRSA